MATGCGHGVSDGGRVPKSQGRSVRGAAAQGLTRDLSL
jgi:hypothetical protein